LLYFSPKTPKIPILLGKTAYFQRRYCEWHYISRPIKNCHKTFFHSLKGNLMDIKQIQELVKIINKTNIAEISIEEEGLKITIKQKEEIVQQVVAAPAVPTPVAAAPLVAAPAAAAAAPKAEAPAKEADNLVAIKSPMIGTFYRSPSPDKPPFIEIGSDVTPGKVVCIVEAMKLFNEIESEIRGKVVKILVEDASPVEYDQPLFLVEPA